MSLKVVRLYKGKSRKVAGYLCVQPGMFAKPYLVDRPSQATAFEGEAALVWSERWNQIEGVRAADVCDLRSAMGA